MVEDKGYDKFISMAIADGIESITRTYESDTLVNRMKREGSVAGFEACVGFTAEELGDLYETATVYLLRARVARHENYTWFRWYVLQVEWILGLACAYSRVQNAPKPKYYDLVTSRHIHKTTELMARMLGLSHGKRDL